MPQVSYVIHTQVFSVKPFTASTIDEWVNFEGSRESLLFPIDAFAVGDKVKISFEKE